MLAVLLQAWASTCTLGPSPAANPPVGENLGFSYSSWVAVVDAWYKQGALYSYKGQRVQHFTEHFTQLIWKGTTKVGCAVNEACPFKMYVCHYSAAGKVSDAF